jgi:putative heme-binding domain-containing protein
MGRSREYILESIVAPAKQIAPGFENVALTLKNGVSYAGTVRSENETELVLHSPEENELVTVKKSDIESRQAGGSGMPEGMGELLGKRDVRDLVEYLHYYTRERKR